MNEQTVIAWSLVLDLQKQVIQLRDLLEVKDKALKEFDEEKLHAVEPKEPA